MFLSVYTCVKNGLHFDFHVVEMLKHHLPLADEIIVNEGYSTDGTFEAISNLDPKIRIIRTHWGEPSDTYAWYLQPKNNARRQCRGEWCLYLDADEFIPEWEFGAVRKFLEHCCEPLVPSRIVDFYGNYKVYTTKSICWRKMNLHRNLPEVEFWGDGANVKLRNQQFNWGPLPTQFTVHHFGSVRHAARLREKWYIQGRMYGKGKKIKLPGFVFNFLPHDWTDKDFFDNLAIYDGPFIKAVRDNPSEFVRDDFKIFKLLESRCTISVGAT
jgi:glycosyltransferase involved in cell wall biosynthesis